KLMLRAHHLGHVPGAVGVTGVMYVSEESWGFGPGGNEAGFLTYALPESTAKQIGHEGLGWFDRLQDGHRSEGWRGRFGDWHRTPVAPGMHWQPNAASGRLEVLDYVCAYGFCIDIDQAQLRAAQQAVNSPGSYYAYGRIGLIVIALAPLRVNFLYNGGAAAGDGWTAWGAPDSWQAVHRPPCNCGERRTAAQRSSNASPSSIAGKCSRCAASAAACRVVVTTTSASVHSLAGLPRKSITALSPE